MAVAYGTQTTLAEATAANGVFSAPASIADGDLLLIWYWFWVASGSAPTPTAPSGFTDAPGTWPVVQTSGTGAGNGTGYLWRKIAASESGSYTVTHTSVVRRGIMVRVTGNDTTTPFEVNPSQNKGNGATTTFLGVTTAVNAELILAFGSDNNDTGAGLTAPTGSTPTFTERVDDLHGNYLATGALATAGATGNKTMTNNSAANSPWIGSLVAVQPPIAVVPPSNLVMAPMTH